MRVAVYNGRDVDDGQQCNHSLADSSIFQQADMLTDLEAHGLRDTDMSACVCCSVPIAKILRPTPGKCSSINVVYRIINVRNC